MPYFNPGLSLLADLYELTMAQSYFRHRRSAQATFDLFIRNIPRNRSYFLFAGLEDILRHLKELKFSSKDLDDLEALGFDEDFLTYLGRMRFFGEVWALPEGTVFFPGEPALRITGSLIETQIIESFLLNTVNISTMIATKAARITGVAEDKGVFDFSLRRTHGIDAAMKAARSSYIAGFRGTSNVLAARRYGMQAVGTMAHSFVMSFAGEREAFRAFFETFPEKTILLVDTYDTKKGIENAIRVALEFKQKGFSLKGIRLDSGSILKYSRMARRMLDDVGLRDTRIFASGDLDEYKIERLLKDGAPVDSFGVGTKMGACADSPYLDVIYKIAEVTNHQGAFLPTMKLSEDKATLPGRKQVFRRYDRRGFYNRDIIGLEHEKLGEPLLKCVMRAGEVLQKPVSLSEVREAALKNLGRLKKSLRALKGNSPYPVSISPALRNMVKGLSKELAGRQGRENP